MKSFLVNLLIGLSIVLCGFNAFQWYREAKLHGRLETLGADIFKKSTEIQGLEQNVKINQEEIKRLDGIREHLNSTLRTNKIVMGQIEDERDKFRKEANSLKAKADQLDQYREAFDKANENLKKQNEIISTQNDKMKQLADDRNDMVAKFNKLATDYKSIGDDYQKIYGMYTNLVAQVQAENEKNSKASKK
jgi:chromosome segregation ATPase